MRLSRDRSHERLASFRMTSLKSIIEWNKMKSGLKIREERDAKDAKGLINLRTGRREMCRRIDANPTCRGCPTGDAGEKRILQLICNVTQMVHERVRSSYLHDINPLREHSPV